MNQAIWTHLARTDLADIDEHYADVNPEFAARVGRTAIAAGDFLAEHRFAGADVDGIYRRWRVPRTPYLILYRPTTNGVVILRVRHVRRGPMSL